MARRRRVIRQAVSALLICVAAIGVSAAPSEAAAPAVACVLVAGRVDTVLVEGGGGSGADTVAWSVSGQGSCVGPAGNWAVSLSGTDRTGGSDVCRGGRGAALLNLEMQLDFRHLADGRRFSQRQDWTVPYTPGVAALPFYITGDSVGAGTALTRLLLQCGDAGDPAARITWAQV